MRTIYDKLRTDPRHETEGVFVDYGDGIRIRVARAGGSNKAFAKAMERVYRKHRRELQLETMSNEAAQRLMQEAFADTIVLGWEGVTDESGKPLEFTRENCLKLFHDLPDLWADVRAQAENSALFRVAIEEIDAKN